MRYIGRLVVLCTLLLGASPLFPAPSRLETAQELLAEERISDAYQTIHDHLLHHPDEPRGWFMKGLILERLGRFTEAMDVYRELIKSHPELPEPYNNLAALLAAAGRFDEAKLTLQLALETHPSYATAHQNLGRIYSAMASSAYRRVLGKDDAHMLVRLDPLEELAAPPEGLLPPATTHVAMASPREPESGTPAPPALPSPESPKPGPATPEAAPEDALDIVSATSPQTATEPTADPDAHEANEPRSDPEPVSTPRAEPALDPIAEPAPEPVPPLPPALEPVIVPAPEPIPAPTVPASPVVEPPSPPAEAPRPQSSPDTIKAAITDTVLNWASAWASQNVEAYLSFYSGNFRPEGGLALARWRDQRRTRVAAPPFINVTLSNIVITFLDDGAAQVRFSQHYRSNVINDEVPKELQLRKEDGQWRITRERLLPRS